VVISLTINNSLTQVRLVKKISLFFSIFQFLIVLIFWVFIDNFNVFTSFDVYNFQFDKRWLFFSNFYYVFGLDNISLLFLLLTFLLTPICILISWNSIKYKYTSFIICLIFITFILFNIFCVLDLVFFIFFLKVF